MISRDLLPRVTLTANPTLTRVLLISVCRYQPGQRMNGLLLHHDRGFPLVYNKV